jgi:uncharacterized membrane protein
LACKRRAVCRNNRLLSGKEGKTFANYEFSHFDLSGHWPLGWAIMLAGLTGYDGLGRLRSMTMDDLALARAIHVLAVVHWIGGMAVVTTIVLPRARRLLNAKDAVEAFAAFERRFAQQVRISILFAGLTGVYMLINLNAWDRFQHASFWWMHLMVAVWVLFAFMVYVLEPFGIDRFFHNFALRQKDRAFALAMRLHMVALLVSALAIIAGVLGAHGG